MHPATRRLTGDEQPGGGFHRDDWTRLVRKMRRAGAAGADTGQQRREFRLGVSRLYQPARMAFSAVMVWAKEGRARMASR